MSLITSEQIQQYNQDGYVIVENVFSEQELKPVLKEFEDIVDEFVEKALSKEGVSIEEFIQEDKKKVIATTPLGKIATPNDIAQIAAFLASSESNMITGKSFTVDGGATMN